MDFTIADFCADARAPTPTAAAEMSAQPKVVWQNLFDIMGNRLHNAIERQEQAKSQRLDMATLRFGRPANFITRQLSRLALYQQRLLHAQRTNTSRLRNRLNSCEVELQQAVQRGSSVPKDRLINVSVRLELLNPALVLKVGYAWMATLEGQAVVSVKLTHPGQALRATLMDGEVDLTIPSPRLI